MCGIAGIVALDGRTKRLLREEAGRHIHPSSLAAPKRGFDPPTDRWIRGRLASYIEVRLAHVGERGLFRPKAVQRIFRKWRMRARSFRGLWEFVSMKLWLGQFMDCTALLREGS